MKFGLILFYYSLNKASIACFFMLFCILVMTEGWLLQMMRFHLEIMVIDALIKELG